MADSTGSRMISGSSGDLGLRVRLGLGEARVTIEPDMLDGMRGGAEPYLHAAVGLMGLQGGGEVIG